MKLNNIETNNINVNLSGQIPLTRPFIEYLIQSNSTNFLNKIKEVMLIISQFEFDNWPNDDYFEKKLPIWFVEIAKLNTQKYIKSNPKLYLWHFGSWLDSMKHRNWVWFSSKVEENHIRIYIDTFDFPFIIDPFEYLIRSTNLVHTYMYFEHGTFFVKKQEWVYKDGLWSYSQLI